MMNSIVRSALRASTMRVFNPVGRRDFARTFWHMSKPNGIPAASMTMLKTPSQACNCGSHYVHTNAEKELVSFLNEEISAEKSSQKPIPSEIDGFKITLKGSEVELTKQNDKEKIQVSFNINHTVDASDAAEFESDEQTMADMKSTPNFEVDIVRGGKTLSFTCSFLKGPAEEGEYNDVFGIDEVTLYEGEWKSENYAVAGELLDGYFYDLLMNLLEEKGISNEFATKVSTLSTNYEHATYVGMLEGIAKFTSGGK